MTQQGLVSVHNIVSYIDEDGKTHILPHDYVADAVKISSHAEAELHRGTIFTAWGTKDSVDVDDHYDLVFRTPASTVIHLIQAYGWIDGAQGQLKVYECLATATATGTGFTPINRNRLSTGEAAAKVETSATATLYDALQINEKVFGGGTDKQGNDVGGGLGAPRSEYVLNTSTVYIIRMLNKSADSATVSTWLLWHEGDKGLES